MAPNFSFWITLACLCIGSQAYVVLVLNKSQYPIIPQVQSHGSSDDAPDSVRGFLLAGKERVYDNSDSWLNHASMAVREGDDRTMSVAVNGGEVSCGTVTFQGGTIVTYDGSTCTKSAMPTINFHKGSDIEKYAWNIKAFDTGEAGSTRVYATGPTGFIWSGARPRESTITIEVVEHSSGQIKEAIAKGYRTNPCGKFAMNDAVTCTTAGNPNLYVDYREADNPNLPAGSYSGVAKIFGQRWYNAGDETINYVNLEITKASEENYYNYY